MVHSNTTSLLFTHYNPINHFDHTSFDHIAFNHAAFDHIAFDHAAFDHTQYQHIVIICQPQQRHTTLPLYICTVYSQQQLANNSFPFNHYITTNNHNTITQHSKLNQRNLLYCCICIPYIQYTIQYNTLTPLTVCILSY